MILGQDAERSGRENVKIGDDRRSRIRARFDLFS